MPALCGQLGHNWSEVDLCFCTAVSGINGLIEGIYGDSDPSHGLLANRSASNYGPLTAVKLFDHDLIIAARRAVHISQIQRSVYGKELVIVGIIVGQVSVGHWLPYIAGCMGFGLPPHAQTKGSHYQNSS
ncbi:hypothetical protein D3C75_1115480 [compost metagenome]